MPDLVLFAAVLAVAGALAGLIAGLLGVGGGIVIVPVLFYLLPAAGVPEDLCMHMAVATSLATIVTTSIISARSHYKRGGVDVALLKGLAPAIVLGAVIGVILGGKASGSTLTLIFAVIALIVSVHMAFFKGRQIGTGGVPGQPVRSLIGLIIGGISVVMGIGGGTLSVPIFSLSGMEMRRAVGTAAAIGLLIALPGTIGFAITGWGEPGLPQGSVGYVSLIGFALIAPLSMLFAPLGAKLAHTIPQVWLSRVFALFLVATSIKMLTSL
ncbi:sulfite exporter TauE/SafE family protein [Acuticoccus sp. MNP-M23]|uniref:sulfite exporter TauE/SafE family protein n=1 Tax=Acuticoccus sp. MNP-M23 TaxID=3072793 RepID=UPI002815934C|nr:sulfite exporter TauE/SafE family protein [Acuticoccus sp. MNP-M23]WMS42117.1 sulfite exporter TauE/SafE family protein [Acuticoccus sp. MNP-M23]